MNTQKFYLNEDDSTQDAAFEILDAIWDGDIYGWDNFLAWRECLKG